MARAEIQAMSGSPFDPHVVQQFQMIPDPQLEEIRVRYPERQDASVEPELGFALPGFGGFFLYNQGRLVRSTLARIG